MRRSTSWSRASSGELIVCLVLLAGCTTRDAKPTPTEPQVVSLFFSSEVRGSLGPCGCSQSMRGGVSRAAAQLEAARGRGEKVHFIDVGDGLFGESPIPPEAVQQQERKAHALGEAWKAMGLTVRTGGPLDDARGPEFRQSLGLPELSARGVKIFDQVGVLHTATVADAQALAASTARSGARFIVAVIDQPFDVLLRESIEVTGIDLLISARSRDAFSAEENKLLGPPSRKLAQIQSKGRSLLQVTVRFHPNDAVHWAKGDDQRDRELRLLDERIELLRAQVNEPMLAPEMLALRKEKLENVIGRREALASAPVVVPQDMSSATARFIPLESSFPQDPKVLALERAYDVDVGLLNVAWAKEHGVSCPTATATTPGMVGTARCTTCHAAAGEVWKRTKHPLAFEALKTQGKEHHLDCVSCHLLGWKATDGVCRIDQTSGREEVGCESCHGPGSLHAAKPSKANITRTPDPSVCTGCHDRENSPHFDFERYLPKILGPGHGA